MRERKPSVGSRSAGVVARQAGIDRQAPNLEYVKVDSNHLGLSSSIVVFRILAGNLAR